MEQEEADLIAEQKKKAKLKGSPHYSEFGTSYGSLYSDIRNVYVDRLFANPNRTMKAITDEAKAEIKKAWTTGYVGNSIPTFIEFKTKPFKSRYCCVAHAIPSKAWPLKKTSPHSLWGMWKWLNDWKEQPFSMEFLSPVFDKNIYQNLKKKSNLVELETDITAERLVIKEYRDNISQQLHFVRRVWKFKMAYGMRDMTRREAFWVAKLGQAFGLHDLTQIKLDIINHYALLYSVSEAYNEYFIASETFDTSELDKNILVFSQIDSIDNPIDKGRVEIEWNLAQELGQVASY